MKKILESFIRNTVFAHVTLIMIFISGFIVAKNMIRETFPEFSSDMISIYVSYPGVSPEEIKENITLKIEEVIKKNNGVKQYTSTSGDGFCSINIEVKNGYIVNEVINSITIDVDSISTFPEGADKPVIKEFIIQDPVSIISISGNISERAIKNFSTQVKKDLQQLSKILSIKVFGNRDSEIFVEISEKNLKKYGISLLDVANIISKNNLNLIAGKISSQNEELRVRTIGKKNTVGEIASIIIVTSPEGGSVPLYKIANIKDKFKEDSVQVSVDGNLAILLIIYKTSEEDSLIISDTVNKYVLEMQSLLPENLNLNVLYDNTNMLRGRINLLLKNGFLGLLIVFLSLWVFLNIRLSFWAVIGILVSISGSLTVLYFLGGTVNMISLFGFIMVLGIIVDDAVVVGEAIYFKRQQGESSFNSAVNGVCEVGLPVFTAVLTSILAFIPLFYVEGIMGKFISILPVVVISCLSVSLIESLFLLPSHLSKLPDLSIQHKRKNFFILKANAIRNFISNKMKWFIHNAYLPFLFKALKFRYLSFSIAIALFFITMGLMKGGVLKFNVFPSVDGFVITSTVDFPKGTPLSITKKTIKKIDNALLSLDNKIERETGNSFIKSRYSIVGETLEAIPKNGSNVGSVQAILLESEKRSIHCEKLMILWEEEIGKIPGIKNLKFEALSGGPPGDPIEIWIQGDNIKILLKAANDLIDHLRKIEGVYQINSDFSQGKNEIHLKLKPEARHLELNVKDIAQQVNSAYYGIEALTIHRNEKDIKIRVIHAEEERKYKSHINKINIRTRSGDFIPLNSIVDISFFSGSSDIIRTNGMRRISVTAGVDISRNNANEILGYLSNKIFPILLDKYPNISISPQGEQKKMRESFSSLFIGFPLSMIGIFIIVAIIFRSYLQPVIIMFTIPFGIIGAVFGHMLLGYDLSIMSIFGMVALTGIVINDAIILIDKINFNLVSGMRFFNAIVNGASRRFMAVFLTSVSTVGGLTPMIFETDLQAKFLIPMAISIAFGVAFASVLTLILIPSLLTILSDIRMVISRIKTGKWRKREVLEPAYSRIMKKIN